MKSVLELAYFEGLQWLFYFSERSQGLTLSGFSTCFNRLTKSGSPLNLSVKSLNRIMHFQNLVNLSTVLRLTEFVG